MPGYPRKSMYAAPEPTVEVKTIKKRFVMPKVTLVQIILMAIIIAYVWSARKMNGVIVGGLALTIALLHFYDHMFLIKRGSEKPIFSTTGERYEIKSNLLRKALNKRMETYTCQSCK